MANKSILAAFERMWQHTVAAIEKMNSFIVTFTGNDTDGYTADKTYAEVAAAIDAGKIVYGVWNKVRLHLWGYDQSALVFHQDFFGENSMYFRITSDEQVKRSSFLYDNGGNHMPTVTTEDDRKQLMVVDGEWKVCASAATSVAVQKVDANTVVVDATYHVNGEPLGEYVTSNSVITLDDNGVPTAVITDGVSCALTWEGFDA